MKKVILFTVALVTMCLTSCKNAHPQVVWADCMYAFADYECRESQVNCEYMTKIYNSKGEYRPDMEKLRDSLTIVFEDIVSECFDSLYTEYGANIVMKMVYIQDGVTLDSKEKLHKYYVNKSVGKILNHVALEIKTQSILNPSEEDKIKAIREALEKGGYSLTD